MATVKEIIQYSKQNPDTPYAKRALQLIQSGAFDERANAEGVDLSWAGRPTTAAPQNTTRPGFSESLRASFGERTKKLTESKTRVQQDEQSLASGLFQGIGQAAGFLGDILFEGANVASGGKLKEGVEAAGEAIGKNENAQKVIAGITKWAEEHPEAAANLEAAVNIAGILPAGKAAQLTVKAAEMGGKKALRVAGDAAELAASATQSFDNLTGSVNTFLSKHRDNLSAGNVDPRAQTAAKRIQDAAPLEGMGAAQQRDITKTYDEFYAQEEKHKLDGKEDPAASVVGSRIGDEFRKVVQLRRDAGKRMEEELKSVGSTQTKIGNPAADFEEILAKEGLEPGEEGLKSTMTQSQFAQQDIKLFDKYIGELRTLEENPSIADLDAFLKRVDSELDLYKAQNHIMGTTNGERIVKMHLHKLREQFEPEIGGASLEAYRDARGAYSELSKFIKEGLQFLGKETQSGDFAKDASLAKSAVQSLLNNGKKDWLIKLEALTGYPALDEAVLAFQAMKDAGNPMGHSLLEIFTKGADKGDLPLSKSSILQRAIEWASGKASEKFLGAPNEQTRRFLESLKKKRGE